MNLGNNNLQRVNVHQLMEKFKSKKELYHFLIQDCQAYLPRADSTNIYFYKAVIRGQKDRVQYIKRGDVKVSAVPHIEGLTVEDFLEYARKHPHLLKFLPDERDWLHLDKKWLCDILYTLEPDGIQNMIDEAMKHRREKLEESQDLMVEMRPEFVQALSNCLDFSTHRGRSAFLLKSSSKGKRRRSELEEVKDEESMLKLDKHEFLRAVKRLKRDKEDLDNKIVDLTQHEILLQSLVAEGVIDEEGNPIRQDLQFNI